MRLQLPPGMIVALLLLISSQAPAAELAIVGTGDGIEIMRALAANFAAKHPDAKIAVPPSIGSGGAVAAVGGDRQMMGRVARPLTVAERAQGLVEVPLVRIPSAFFTHPDIGVRGLPDVQVASIFAGELENWTQVGGPDLRVRVVRREDTDSTLSALRSSMPGWRTLALTSRSKIATTTQEAVETVKSVPGAIGFGPYSPGLESATTILAIDGRAPTDRAYPSAVVLSLIYKLDRIDELAKSFLDYATSPAARRVLTDGGGVPVEP